PGRTGGGAVSAARPRRAPDMISEVIHPAHEFGPWIDASLISNGCSSLLALKPAIDELDLAEWAAANRELLEGRLYRHGAILFRGFGLESVAEFETVAGALSERLLDSYGDLPRRQSS